MTSVTTSAERHVLLLLRDKTRLRSAVIQENNRHMRLYILAFMLLVNTNTLACRAPVNIDASIIEISYLSASGEYSIKIPAQIGDSKKGRAGLYFMKAGSSIYFGEKEFGRELEMIRQEASLIGKFSAHSKEGYEAYIRATWPVRPCPAVSTKKIKLFPKDVKVNKSTEK